MQPHFATSHGFLACASAATLHVNYYTDGGCATWDTDVYPGPSGGCYDYKWTGSNSADIADCTFPNGLCVCTFYTQGGCKGAGQTVVYGEDVSCASNWGHGFQSMECYVEHDP